MSALSIVRWLGDSAESVDVARRTRVLANRLHDIGVRPGDRVLYAVRPTKESLPLALAVLECGAVIVAAPIGGGQTLFDAQMRLVQPGWVLGESAVIAAGRSAIVRRVLSAAGARLPSFDALQSRFIRVGPWLPGTRSATALSLTSDGDARPRDNGRSPDDAMFVVFTSGTTATPKAVLHSWRSVTAMLQVITRNFAIDAGDVMYARDLHLLVPALAAGASVAFPRVVLFDPEAVLAELETSGATHMFAVTAEMQALVEHLESTGAILPATLRHIMIGAAPARPPFLRRLQQVLSVNARVSCIYGMTEMLPIAIATLEEKLAHAGEGDFVGQLVHGVEARIAADGELLVRGPHQASYAGGASLDELPTGDIARIDGRAITLLGRKKDMIIRGQHNIYPELHEPVIEQIPGVRRAAMVGVYDEASADERVVLFIEPENGAGDAFADRVRQRLPGTIDSAAQPDRVVIAPIPLSGRSSKVDKVALRARAREELGCA